MAGKSKDAVQDYVEGAIVKIKLTNFMTYKKFEVYPGARMNVILGPNGSGKSTILCAICLGLGGKPADVGRAGRVAEYIKHGCAKATIEIELYDSNVGNYVIIRQIQANNQSTWTINSKPSDQKAIDKLMSKLNVQMKNLCQFLPQDKVVEFVRMSNEDLLDSTEKAANVNDMWENHSKLKDWHKNSHNLEQSLARVREEYEREFQRNTYLEEQYNIYKTRQGHLENIDLFKKKKALLVYQRENDKYKGALEEQDIKAKELRELNSKMNPLRQSLKQKVSDAAAAESNSKELISAIQQLKTRASEKLRQCERLKEKTYEETTLFKEKLREESDRVNRLNDAKAHLVGLQGELATATQDDAKINSELEAVSAEIAEYLNKNNINQDDRDAAAFNKHELEREQSELIAELKQLKDVHLAKWQMLRQRNRDAHDVAEWIKDNKNKFKGTIHGPIMVEINVRNPENAKYIENTIPFKDLVLFICEEKSDIELLMDTASKTLRKKVNVAMAPTRHYTEFSPSMTIDSVRHLGFHSYLIDMIDASDVVLSYLCTQFYIHTIPVGNEKTRSKVNEILQTTNFRTFFTQNHKYHCCISKYGDHCKSTSCIELRQATLLTANVNTARIQELENKLEQLKPSIKAINERIVQLQRTERQINERMEGLRNRKRELHEKKNHLKYIKQRISQKEANIRTLEGSKIDLELEKQKRNAALIKINEEKLKLIGQHEKLCKEMIPLAIKRVGLACELRILDQTKKSMEKELQNKSEELVTLERVVDTLKRNIAKIKEQVRNLFAEAKRVNGMTSNTVPESLNVSFSVLPNTIEELDNEIHRLQVKADCMRTANASTMDDYRESKRKIQLLETQKQDLESQVSQSGADMESVKNKWLPPLLSLLRDVNKRFSHYLKSLGCAGEVGLNKGENEKDYSKYGISIKVKFRDGDPLRELTQFYQSGGERSVATVLYLLSLQEFVKLPFCCVDEINQGMDSTNERRVFQLMTQILSSETRSQYFLVTPKLLPDMEFHENVMIHFVTSGSISIPSHLNVDIYIKRRAEMDLDE